MPGHWTYFFLFLWTFAKASVDSRESTETQKKKDIFFPTLAPNSKFLNPHVDDATNLQFAIAAFDDVKIPENNKRRASEILSKLSDGWASQVSSRDPKSLYNWRIVPFLNSLFNGVDKNYKFKKI